MTHHFPCTSAEVKTICSSNFTVYDLPLTKICCFQCQLQYTSTYQDQISQNNNLSKFHLICNVHKKQQSTFDQFSFCATGIHIEHNIVNLISREPRNRKD